MGWARKITVIVSIVSSISSIGFTDVVQAAGQPRIASAYLAEQKDGKRVSAFKPDSQFVYVMFTLADAPRGTLVRCLWFAEKVEVVPPDYKLYEAQVRMGGGGVDNQGNCWISRPNNGWPVGRYRVELYVAERKGRALRFNVR
ncbi:MAG: hypothetical protein WD140_03985 [bacterium]